MPNPIVAPEDLNFGALAAERDDTLQSYFVESDAFKNLRDGKCWVALANRGAGKSAIFRMIAAYERAKKTTVIELSPDDYSYEILAQTMLPEQKGAWAKQGAYAAAWKYVIYVLAMKAVAESGPRLKTGSEAKIYEYLRDHHKNFDKNPIATLISYLKRLEGFKVGSYEASVKARELQQLYRLGEIAPLLEALNGICAKRRVIILVDELDKGWDKSEDAIAFVSGLFAAAVAISTQTPNVRVLISLRRELYESIPALYEDAQKVRDVVQLIEWDEEGLLELIARRIAHVAPHTAGWTKEARWALVFSETLDYRQARSFNYLVDRTLHRPREMIQVAILVRDKLLAAKQSLPATYQVISAAEHDYSEGRVKDIAAEYRFQYPGLRSVFETFRGLKYNFEREEIEEHCLAIATGEKRVDGDAGKWCSNADPDDLIRALWTIGFLRAQAVGGLKGRRRSGSSFLGSHQISSLSLANIPRFHVHPMFRPFLGMKEPKAGG